MNAGTGRQKYGVALFGPTALIPPFTFYEFWPNLNYLLDVFGGTRRTIERQQALAKYQENEVNATYLSLTGNIAKTTLTIALINEQIEITKKLIQADEKMVTLLQKAYRLGSATKMDLLNAQNQLLNDRTFIPPRFIFTFSVWQLPSAVCGGTYPKM